MEMILLPSQTHLEEEGVSQIAFFAIHFFRGGGGRKEVRNNFFLFQIFFGRKNWEVLGGGCQKGRNEATMKPKCIIH